MRSRLLRRLLINWRAILSCGTIWAWQSCITIRSSSNCFNNKSNKAKSLAKSTATISHRTNENNIKASLNACRWLRTRTTSQSFTITSRRMNRSILKSWSYCSKTWTNLVTNRFQITSVRLSWRNLRRLHCRLGMWLMCLKILCKCRTQSCIWRMF